MVSSKAFAMDGIQTEDTGMSRSGDVCLAVGILQVVTISVHADNWFIFAKTLQCMAVSNLGRKPDCSARRIGPVSVFESVTLLPFR